MQSPLFFEDKRPFNISEDKLDLLLMRLNKDGFVKLEKDRAMPFGQVIDEGLLAHESRHYLKRYFYDLVDFVSKIKVIGGFVLGFVSSPVLLCLFGYLEIDKPKELPPTQKPQQIERLDIQPKQQGMLESTSTRNQLFF